jgi:hypothetical protein
MAVIRRNTGDVGAETRACTTHPDRETLVACGRCLRPFCTQCLIHTPAGQRCFECAGVRRDYVQRAATRRFLSAFGAMLLGGAISTLLGGFFSLFIAFAAGGAAGQTLSPAITRHNRPWVYIPAVLVLLAGGWLGFSLGILVRVLLTGAFDPVLLVVAPLAALRESRLLVFLGIAAIVAWLRMK